MSKEGGGTEGNDLVEIQVNVIMEVDGFLTVRLPRAMAEQVLDGKIISFDDISDADELGGYENLLNNASFVIEDAIKPGDELEAPTKEKEEEEDHGDQE